MAKGTFSDVVAHNVILGGYCTDRQAYVNIVDSAQILQNTASDLGLHFLYVMQQFQRYHWSYGLMMSMPASVAQLDAPSDWRPGDRGFNPRRGRQHSFVEVDNEIFSMVILYLPLIHKRPVVSFWRKNVHNTG